MPSPSEKRITQCWQRMLPRCALYAANLDVHDFEGRPRRTQLCIRLGKRHGRPGGLRGLVHEPSLMSRCVGVTFRRSSFMRGAIVAESTIAFCQRLGQSLLGGCFE